VIHRGKGANIAPWCQVTGEKRHKEDSGKVAQESGTNRKTKGKEPRRLRSVRGKKQKRERYTPTAAGDGHTGQGKEGGKFKLVRRSIKGGDEVLK